MVATIIISSISVLGMILASIFYPKLKIKRVTLQTYYFFPLLGLILLLATNCLNINDFWNGLTSSTTINPLNILLLFLAMSFLSIVLDELGFFKYLALLTIRKAKGSQFKLFIILYILISILTIFTSNDIIILTFTPFIIFYAKEAKINPIPYLIGEFIAANTWSMFLIIGNPTNIYIASYLNIDFFQYLKVMALPTLAAGLISLGLMLLIFNKQLKVKMEINSDSTPTLNNKLIVYISLGILLATVILMAISNYINIKMYLISLIMAGVEIIILIILKIKKHDDNTLWQSTKRLPYSIIPFIISMFAIVLALKNQGITNELAKAMAIFDPTFGYGYISFISCNLINNIPMSVLFSSIIESSAEISSKAIYATIIGSNLGAFLTPLGALAGIMFLSNLRKENIQLSYLKFSFYGVLIALPTISLSLLVIFLEKIA